MSVSSTEHLDELAAVLPSRPTGRNIIAFAAEVIKQLSTENGTLWNRYESSEQASGLLQRKVNSLEEEIERLRNEKAMLLTAKKVEIVTPPLPESELVDILRKMLDDQVMENARLRGEAACAESFYRVTVEQRDIAWRQTDTLRNELAETENANRLNSNALRLAHEKIERLNKELASEKGWVQQYRDVYNKQVAEIEQLTRELKACKLVNHAVIEEQKAEIAQLRKELQDRSCA
jgi:hypothetical protein